jgi:hypothetical protein
MCDTTFDRALAQLHADLADVEIPEVTKEERDTAHQKIKIQRGDEEIMRKFHDLPEDCNLDDYFEYMTPAENERNRKSQEAAEKFFRALRT